MNAPFSTRQQAESWRDSQAQLATFTYNAKALPAAPDEFPMHWKLVAWLLALFCFVLVLVAFLILGEWPQRKPPVVPPHLQHLKK
jgi:hypothetical protein